MGKKSLAAAVKATPHRSGKVSRMSVWEIVNQEWTLESGEMRRRVSWLVRHPRGAVVDVDIYGVVGSVSDVFLSAQYNGRRYHSEPIACPVDTKLGKASVRRAAVVFLSKIGYIQERRAKR